MDDLDVVKSGKVIRCFSDRLCNNCYIEILDTVDNDRSFQVDFHISGISAEYANKIYNLIYDYLMLDDVVDPKYIF